MNKTTFYTLLFLLIYTAILLFFAKIREKHLKKNYVAVIATVIDMDSHVSRSTKGPNHIRVYQPKLSYSWNGWTRTVRPKAYVSFWKYDIGSEIILYVNPKDPDDWVMPDTERWILRLIWGLGVIFALARLI
ncbi:MAG: DUF3592 domain-containing protein [Eubacteriales bacterium]|nr:DUF3592 domain-containing protein [Eubacteriales bacterium]